MPLEIMDPTPVAAEMDSCGPLDVVAPARPDYGGADADAKVLSDALGLHHPGLRARVLGRRRAGGGGMVHLAPKEEDCGNSSVPWLGGGEFGVIFPFQVVFKVEENRVTAFLLSHFGSVLRTEILLCSASDYFSGASEVVEGMAAATSGGMWLCGGLTDQGEEFGRGILRERLGNRIVIRSEDCTYVAKDDNHSKENQKSLSAPICSQCDLLQKKRERKLRVGKGPDKPRGPKQPAQRKSRRLRLPPPEETGGKHIYLKEEQGVRTEDIPSRLPESFVRLERLEDQDLNALIGNVVKKKEERNGLSLECETDFWEGESVGEEGWEDGGGGEWEEEGFQDDGEEEGEKEWKPEEQDEELEEEEEQVKEEDLQDVEGTSDVGAGQSSSSSERGRGKAGHPRGRRRRRPGHVQDEEWFPHVGAGPSSSSSRGTGNRRGVAGRDIAKVCPTCGKECASTYKLKIHIAVAHDPEGPESRICDLCGKRFGHKDKLKRHMLQMHGTKTFNCHSCDKTFNNPKSYSKHIKVQSKVRPWLCDVCNYRGIHRDRVLQHIRRVHSMEAEAALAVIRKDGDYEYGNDGGEHIDGLKPPANHVCHLCSKTYGHVTKLNRHILLSHEQEPRMYQCTTCGKIFSKGRNYYNHLKVHSSVKPWLCTLCGYRSVRRYGTLVHVRRVHGLSTAIGQGVIAKDGLYSYEGGKQKQPGKTDEGDESRLVSAIVAKRCVDGSYRCNVCGKTFPNSNGYCNHIKVHSSVKPWLCTVCGFRSVWQNNALVHARKVHGLSFDDAKAALIKDGLYTHEANRQRMEDEARAALEAIPSVRENDGEDKSTFQNVLGASDL